MKTLWCALSLILLVNYSYSATWYVSKNATGANTGTSWADAFTQLESAISSANPNDEVWVAAGIYRPGTDSLRTNSFSLKNGVKFLGGFAGNETASSQRNYVANVTTLSGNIGQPGIATDNCYNVVTALNVSTLTVLDGFTIMEGYANGTSLRYGAGINITGGSPRINNCTFMLNHAMNFGGAVNKTGAGTAVFTNCNFNNNDAISGGVIYVSNSNIDFVGCNFINNIVSGTGGVLFCNASNTGALNFTNCQFAENTADDGGAIYWNAGILTITGCTFHNNQVTTSGGAMEIYDGTVNINRCVFTNNVAAIQAGAIKVLFYSNLNLRNSLIAGNFSNDDAAIHIPVSNSGNHTLVNCTISGNKSTSSDFSGAVVLNPDAQVINCIITGNADVYQLIGGGVQNTLIQGTYSVFSGTPYTFSPNFVNPGNAASAPFDASTYNYHLNLSSLAIDKGSNSSVFGVLDLDSSARISGTLVDLGAYEGEYCQLNGSVSPSPSFTLCGGSTAQLSASGGTNYLWEGGQTDSVITITTEGIYRVVVTDSLCRYSASVQVYGVPVPVAVITYTAATNTLSAPAGAASYQWFLNGDSIPGAIAANFTPLVSGAYTVLITNGAGCEALSNPYNYTYTHVADVYANNFSLYPNPAGRTINISTGDNTSRTLQLINLQGKLCRSVSFAGYATLDVSDIEPGMYLAIVKDESGACYVQKVIKAQ